MVSTALALPDVRLRTAWAETLREFGDDYPHGSGLDPEHPPALDADGCAAFVADRLRHADPVLGPPPGRVPCTYFWVLEDGPGAVRGRMVGFLAVRHELDGFLLEQGGHVGYSVRPSARGLGHASRALRLGLDHAAALGLDRVLLTCEPTNVASQRTIERAGGVYEDSRAGKRRFWVEGLRTRAGGAARALR